MTASGVRPHGVSRSQRRRLTADGPLAGSFRWGRAYAKAPRASSEELKTYALSCPDCLATWFRLSRTKQAACRRAAGEVLDAPGIYDLERGKRDRALHREIELERGLA